MLNTTSRDGSGNPFLFEIVVFVILKKRPQYPDASGLFGIRKTKFERKRL